MTYYIMFIGLLFFWGLFSIKRYFNSIYLSGWYDNYIHIETERKERKVEWEGNWENKHWHSNNEKIPSQKMTFSERTTQNHVNNKTLPFGLL
jgi:hypothetical protein